MSPVSSPVSAGDVAARADGGNRPPGPWLGSEVSVPVRGATGPVAQVLAITGLLALLMDPDS